VHARWRAFCSESFRPLLGRNSLTQTKTESSEATLSVSAPTAKSEADDGVEASAVDAEAVLVAR